jgi:acyl-coenzyme A thioesterase PaaI-like protein
LSFQKISDLAGNFTATLDDSDELGNGVAWLGDLDGAGASVAALAVCASFDDDGGFDRGAVYILFLNSNGTVSSHTKISDSSIDFNVTLVDGDEFGSSVAFLGDLDGNGPSTAAIAVGTIGDADGGLGRGAVYILFLDSAGAVMSHTKISDTAGNFTATLDDFDEFGCSVAWLGDLDGPGGNAGALAVGAFGDDDGGFSRGAVYVLFLDSAGGVVSHQKISDLAGNFTGELLNLDGFGDSIIGLGDLDGTGGGVVSLAVGASGDDDGGSLRGAVWVLFLGPTGLVVSHQKISDLEGNFTGVIDSGDEMGGSVANLGDLDGTGSSRVCLATGAIGDDDGGLNRGSAWLLFLEGGEFTDSPGLPQRPGHVLESARPNPFNPTATIPFQIASAGWVEIDLFDARGQQVRRMVVGMRPEGAHDVVLDGKDDAGRPLPSGTYYFRMRVDGQSVTPAQRAVLLK